MLSPPGGAGPAVATAAALFVGVVVAFQARVNAALAGRLGGGVRGGVEAALMNFTTGLAVVSVLVLVLPAPRAAMRRLRGPSLAGWERLGGVGGAGLIAVQAATVPVLGVALFTVGVVAGQTTSSLLVDRAGLGPAGRQLVTVRRVVAAALAVGAVALAVSGRLGSSAFSLPFVLACVAGGCAVSVQSALNGRVGAATHSALAAAWLSFVVGGCALALLEVGLLAFGKGPQALPHVAWLYLGGPLGLSFVAVVAWVVRVVGVLLVTLATVAGQVIGAVVLDAVNPATGQPLAATTVVGATLTLLAVVLGTARRRPRP